MRILLGTLLDGYCQKIEKNKYCQECWEMETLVHSCWECKWCSCCEKQFDVPQKAKRGIIAIVVVQSLSRVQLFATSWTIACQASLSFTIFRSSLRLMSTESVMPSYHLHLCRLQSFPTSGSFLVTWLFTSGGQSIGASASASVLLMNIQGWFPLGLTGLISLLSRGLSKIFSSITVRRHQFFSAQPFLLSSCHIHTLLEKP